MLRTTVLLSLVAALFGCSGESGSTSGGDTGTPADAAVVTEDTAVVDSGTDTRTDSATTDTGCTPACEGKACAADDGCGGKCKSGTCPKGFLCSGFLPPTGSPVQCEVAGDWQITITTGSLPKDRGWDTSNDPDPFVCLTFDGMRECTNAPMNTRTPTWNYKFKSRKFAPLAVGPEVEMFDDDGSTTMPDVICPKGLVSITRDHFVSGKWGASCSTTGMPADVVMSFEATLTAL